jgi:hypothetical protein
MNAVLVDTDLFSFLFKGHPFGALDDADLHGKTGALSFITVAKLDRWAIQSNWGETRKNWLHLFMDHLRRSFTIARSAKNGPKLSWRPRRVDTAFNVRMLG